MNPLFHSVRFVYHIRYWLIIIPLVVALFVIFYTRDEAKEYAVETSIYTGFISGGNSIVDDPEASMSSVQNAKMENMITTITAASTLKKVSIKLFATNMIYGNPDEDNTFIKAVNFRKLQTQTPDEVKKLIDKSSIDRTVDSLTQYSLKDSHNYIYGLLNWHDPHYSYAALSKITAKRIGFSEILKITYSANDPGIAYNTLKILDEVFAGQYDQLQLAGANDVIEFFKNELNKVETELENSENDLTTYSVKNKIINYGEQTKQIAAMSRDFTLQFEEINFKYYGSKALVDNLEKRIGNNVKILKTNNEFLEKLKVISNLTSHLTEMHSFEQDSTRNKQAQATSYTKQLRNAENDFKSFVTAYYNEKYSKEGYPNEEIIEEWLSEVLNLEEYSAQKKVLDTWKNELDGQYSFYSPIGADIKRKERQINFTETSYLAVLKALHDAILRQKSMEMTTATLKVVTPPSFPLSAVPSKRKTNIMAAYVGSFIFIIFFFIIVDFLDQTLRDRLRTQRITGQKVIGAYPAYSLLEHGGCEELQKDLVIGQLANSLIHYFKEDYPQIINILSIEPKEGKSEISKHLAQYWSSKGLKVRSIDWQTDLTDKSRELVLGKSIKSVIDVTDEDIILVEYSPVKHQSISNHLLEEATFNLLVARADRTWKETDRIALAYLVDAVKDTPMMIELNNARLSVVEEFTDLLPPYPKIRRIGYRILHLGLTSKEKLS